MREIRKTYFIFSVPRWTFQRKLHVLYRPADRLSEDDEFRLKKYAITLTRDLASVYRSWFMWACALHDTSLICETRLSQMPLKPCYISRYYHGKCIERKFIIVREYLLQGLPWLKSCVELCSIQKINASYDICAHDRAENVMKNVFKMSLGQKSISNDR